MCILNFSLTLIGLFVVLLPTLFDVLLPNAIWKSHIIARAARKKITGRVAPKGGVITVRGVREKVTKIVETEVEKARRALERAEAAELKKENARIAAHRKLWKQLHKELKAYLKARPALAYLLK